MTIKKPKAEPKNKDLVSPFPTSLNHSMIHIGLLTQSEDHLRHKTNSHHSFYFYIHTACNKK